MDTNNILKTAAADAVDMLRTGRAYDALELLEATLVVIDLEERCQAARKLGIAPGLRLPQAIYAGDGALVLIEVI